jgi:glycosyltransferase involved in cell wall biosynthesis
MIFISKPLLDWAEREEIGRDVPKAVIYSGIDVESFQSAGGAEFRRGLGIPPERLVVGMISKLWEGKGHDILFLAWKELLESLTTPPPLLLVVGEGYLESALRKQVAKLGLESSVIFTGFHSNVAEVTAATDVTVLPSLFEGMGRVVLEGMAAGKPVIASNVGGIPDLIRHGENGLLVQPGSPHALKVALLEVISKPDLRAKLAAGARIGFRPEFSSVYMVERIHQFYNQARELKANQAG